MSILLLQTFLLMLGAFLLGAAIACVWKRSLDRVTELPYPTESERLSWRHQANMARIETDVLEQRRLTASMAAYATSVVDTRRADTMTREVTATTLAPAGEKTVSTAIAVVTPPPSTEGTELREVISILPNNRVVRFAERSMFWRLGWILALVLLLGWLSYIAGWLPSAVYYRW